MLFAAAGKQQIPRGLAPVRNDNAACKIEAAN
jgi:hypothetical protein